MIERSVGTEFGSEVAKTYLSLERGGDVPGYDVTSFRHKILRVTEHVLPDEVSPLSNDQLLGIVSNLLDAKDPYTGGHSCRVAVLAVAVADQLGLDEHMKVTLWAGGYLHDLGKLGVPLRVLTKKSKLTEEKFAYIRAHPSDGAEILESIPTLQHLTTGARYRHERWDGSGYPEGLSGGHIPMVAQTMAVCDAYDAMTSRRAYRDARACPRDGRDRSLFGCPLRSHGHGGISVGARRGVRRGAGRRAGAQSDLQTGTSPAPGRIAVTKLSRARHLRASNKSVPGTRIDRS